MLKDCTLKPDLVAFRHNKVVVIDTLVISDQYHLETVHDNKIIKYMPFTPILRYLRAGGVETTSLTMNWHGVVSKAFFLDLCQSWSCYECRSKGSRGEGPGRDKDHLVMPPENDLEKSEDRH